MRAGRCVAVADSSEVVPQAFFQTLDYKNSYVPWDLLGQAQPLVCDAALAGDFGVEGTSILDCGCGAGDNANWLAASGFDVFGFDLSPSAISTACARAAEADVAAAIAMVTLSFVVLF